MSKGIHRKIAWTPEDRARHKAIRERFQRERPSIEELVATGEFNEPIPHGEYLTIRLAMTALKKARKEAGISLAQAAKRSGIDKATLSALESGAQLHPTLNTLYRYAKVVGKQIVCTFEDLPASSESNGLKKRPRGVKNARSKRPKVMK